MKRIATFLVVVCSLLAAETTHAALPEQREYYSIQFTAIPLDQQEKGHAIYDRLKDKGYLVYFTKTAAKGKHWMRLKHGVFSTLTEAKKHGDEFSRLEGYGFFVTDADVHVQPYGSEDHIVTTPNAVWMKKTDQNRVLLEFNPEPLEAADVLSRVRTVISPDGAFILCEYDSRKYTIPADGTRTSDEDLKKAQVLFARGTQYSAAGHTDLAIDDFNSALSINPGLTEAYCSRGDAFKKEERYDRAVNDYKRCLELNNDNAAAYYKLGMSYYKQENLDQAIENFGKALSVDRQYTAAYFYRGIAHYRQGRYDQAIADCTDALAIDPDHSDAYSIRALVWLEKGEHDRAIKDCDRALAINPGDIAAYSTLGVAWLQKGEVEWACSDLQKACDLGRCETLETVRKQGYCE